MKKTFAIATVFLFFLSFLHASSFPSLLNGIYLLEGSNPNSEKINYRGEVEIRSSGSNYTLTWKIGNSQTQTGIGILKDHILSVAYYDLSGKGTGVVSYSVVGPDKLEGYWAGYGTVSSGREWLIYNRP